MATRTCASCGLSGAADAFSRRQWRKGVGRSRCEHCVHGGRAAGPVEVYNESPYSYFSDEALREPFEEGAFRDVALGHYVDEHGNAGAPCVAKWLKDAWASSAGFYREDMRCVRRALQFVRAFNAAGVFGAHLRVVVPALGRFGAHSALAGLVYLREPFLDGYEKWNSNSGWADAGTELGDAMQALSHFSYHASGGQLVLCDLQGGRDAHGGAVLTDPAVLSPDMSYGDTDMGADGILSFFAHHTCGDYCDAGWAAPHETAHFLTPVGHTTRWDGDTAVYVDSDGEHAYVPGLEAVSEGTESSAGESADASDGSAEGEEESVEYSEEDSAEYSEEGSAEYSEDGSAAEEESAVYSEEEEVEYEGVEYEGVEYETAEEEGSEVYAEYDEYSEDEA